jgi:UTP--glucose-1-phosphate uridylyltransferase
MKLQNPVRKAVFPVGGYGTGILPATKATPKELLTVVDKPLIHYAVEEALRAGTRQMIFVTHRSKRAIEDHFDKAYELEGALALQNRYELLAELRHAFPPDVTYLFVRQSEPLGLGHALSCARVLVADEPFLVIVPDELLDAPTPAAVQLVNAFRRCGHPTLGALPQGGGDGVHAYVESVRMAQGVGRVTRLHAPAERVIGAAPVAGRFVLTPAVFDYLATTPPRANGEIELADALAAMLTAHPLVACELDGERFDCGSRLGYLAATVHFGLRHPVVGEKFASIVRAAAATRGATVTPARRPPAALRVATD